MIGESCRRRTRKAIARGTLTVAIALTLAAIFLAVTGRNEALRAVPRLDEYGWTHASARTFRLAFLERDFSSAAWIEGNRPTYGWINPNFAKLVLGGVLHASRYDLSEPSFSSRRAAHRGVGTG